ncbi:MAG: lanthionine synthetase LanC family protein [Gemmatimonadales bacterium]|jgi:lantibiotic modifying enzyme
MTARHPSEPSYRVANLSRRDLLKAGLAASAAATLRPNLLFSALPDFGLPTFSERPYLEVARRAERWIARSAIPGEIGTAWPWNPDDPGSVQLSLYTGMPGVVLFYLELFGATGERAALDEAAAGAEYLAASLPGDDRLADAGLYTGLAGVAYTLALTYRETRQASLGDAAKRALATLQRAAQPEGRGVKFNESTDIISGSAGIGLFLLWAAAQLDDAPPLDLAAAAGRRLIELGVPERGGLKWTIAPGVPRNYPNFSHGTAGVSYFLASLYGATGEGEFLDAALAGAAYLQELATRTANDGRMIFHSEPGNEQLYYLGWCHGPVGTARAFHRLGQLTGDAQYRHYVAQLAQAIVDMKVPERSPGFWNNVSQCCGNAGVIEFFLALHNVTGEPHRREFAERVASDTVDRATAEDGGLKWVQAEHRVRPDLLIAQTGLMQGAAGVGLAMLHLDGVSRSRRPLVVLPDDPFWG